MRFKKILSLSLLIACSERSQSRTEPSMAAADSSGGDASCHASKCTPGFDARGDIAPLGRHPETRDLLDRLDTLDCSPHSIPPLQVFAEADPKTRQSQLFMYYLLDSTGFEPSVFTTVIPGVNDT